MSVERFAIENAEVCGVYVAHESEPLEVDLMTGEISGSAIGACVQAPDYDIGRLSNDVRWVDNGANFDTSSTLPTPPIPSF